MDANSVFLVKNSITLTSECFIYFGEFERCWVMGLNGFSRSLIIYAFVPIFTNIIIKYGITRVQMQQVVAYLVLLSNPLKCLRSHWVDRWEGVRQGCAPPSSPNSFIFMEFLSKQLQNNRLAYPLWELATTLKKILNLSLVQYNSDDSMCNYKQWLLGHSSNVVLCDHWLIIHLTLLVRFLELHPHITPS